MICSASKLMSMLNSKKEARRGVLPYMSPVAGDSSAHVFHLARSYLLFYFSQPDPDRRWRPDRLL